MTNFYFGTKHTDDDLLNEKENFTEKEIRKLGVCKEESFKTPLFALRSSEIQVIPLSLIKSLYLKFSII